MQGPRPSLGLVRSVISRSGDDGRSLVVVNEDGDDDDDGDGDGDAGEQCLGEHVSGHGGSCTKLQSKRVTPPSPFILPPSARSHRSPCP